MDNTATPLSGRLAERLFGLNRRSYLALLLVTIGASGCNGGSGGWGGVGSGAIAGATPPGNTKPSGRGTVVVKIKDVLGVPVAGADVRINTYWGEEDKNVLTDADGRAEVSDVIASKVSITVFGPDL